MLPYHFPGVPNTPNAVFFPILKMATVQTMNDKSCAGSESLVTIVKVIMEFVQEIINGGGNGIF